MEIYEDTTVIELEAQVRRLERRLDFLTEYADEQLTADYRAFVVAEEAAEVAKEAAAAARDVEVRLEDLVVYRGSNPLISIE